MRGQIPYDHSVVTRIFKDEPAPTVKLGRAERRQQERLQRRLLVRGACLQFLGGNHVKKSTAKLLGHVSALHADRNKRATATRRTIQRKLAAIDREIARADLQEG